MNNWTLYRHTSPSGKVYIGITSRDPEVRWGNNGSHYRGSVFVNAILKYGWDNIKHEVLFTHLTEKKAKHLEVELIRHYKKLGISYNMTDGGDGTVGFHPSEETRKRMRQAQAKIDKSTRIAVLNRSREEIGIKHRKPVVQLNIAGSLINTYEGGKFAEVETGIAARSIAACCKGKAFKAGGYLWMYLSDYNKYLSEGRLKEYLMTIIHKATMPSGCYERTEEWRKRKSEEQKGVEKRSKATIELMKQRSIESLSKSVVQMTLDGTPIAVYTNGMQIQNTYGFSSSYIGSCCNGKKKTAYGYKWKYITKEEYEEYKKTLEAA